MAARVLVTGANGFLGFHLSRLLVDEGYECHLFVLDGTVTHWLDSLVAQGARIFAGDILEPATIEPAMASVDLVFHTAGTTEEWARDPRRILQINVEGTRNVCRAALDANVTRLVFTSSAAAAGSAPAGGLATEDALWDLWDAGPYAVSKLLAEKEVFQWGARGLDVTALLPHQMIGDHDFRPSTPGGLLLRFLRGHLPVAVEASTQLLDVADAARAHLLAARRGRRGERYLLPGPEVVTARELFAHLEAISNIRAPRFLPASTATVAAAPLHWIADHLTRRPPPLTRGNARLLRKRVLLDGAAAQRDLGFRPGDWRPAVERAVAWFRDNTLSRSATAK